MITQDQIMSMIRTVLQILGTVLTTRGVITETDWSTLVGGVLMIIPVVWSLIAHRQAGVINSAARLTDVKEIITTPAAAVAGNLSNKVRSERGR